VARFDLKRQLAILGVEEPKISTPPARPAVLLMKEQRWKVGLQLVAMSQPPPKLPPLFPRQWTLTKVGLDWRM
jgi:hypothetical protein